MKHTILLAFLVPASLLQVLNADSRIEYDFNFDGHMDYCTCEVDNAKGSEFDVYIYDPKQSKHVRDETLSGTIFPRPNEATKEVHCTFSGGHSGLLFTREVYSWNGTGFDLVRTVRQDSIRIENKIHYVRAVVELKHGKPVVTRIESVQQ